jgi:hypothetical protein
MKTDNKWLYVGGVVVLITLVVVGLTWKDGDSSTARDGGSARVDGGSTGGDASPSEGASQSDAAGDEEAEGVDLSSAHADAAVVEPVPESPAECRAYCERLAERGALADGATAVTCAEQLCGGDSAETASASSVPTITEPTVPELPDDCQAQCRALQDRGELRDGMSLEDCIEALCSSGEEEAEDVEE